MTCKILTEELKMDSHAFTFCWVGRYLLFYTMPRVNFILKGRRQNTGCGYIGIPINSGLSKGFQGPNNGKRRGSQNIDPIKDLVGSLTPGVVTVTCFLIPL